MPNIYLQRDLGIIGDLIHSYRKDIANEFKNNLHLYNIPKDYFDKKVVKIKYKRPNYIKQSIWYLKNFFNINTTMSNFSELHKGNFITGAGAWKMNPLLYHKRWIWEPTNKIETVTWQQQDGITFGTRSAYDTIKQHYPKLTEMIDKLRTEYGIDSVNKVTYSILTANGNIGVHTGRDNIHSEYIRCHIPLIIPEHTRDEMYLEANADKVYWTETWGFDNQIPHTAKNATDYHRLVLIIDISRDALCLVKKKKYNKKIAHIKRLTKIYTNQGRDCN